jgi:hypothetical protein
MYVSSLGWNNIIIEVRFGLACVKPYFLKRYKTMLFLTDWFFN